MIMESDVSYAIISNHSSVCLTGNMIQLRLLLALLHVVIYRCAHVRDNCSKAWITFTTETSYTSMSRYFYCFPQAFFPFCRMSVQKVVKMKHWEHFTETFTQPYRQSVVRR